MIVTPSEANRDKHINFVALESGDIDPSDELAPGKLSDKETKEKNRPASEHTRKSVNLKNVFMPNSKRSKHTRKENINRTGSNAPQNRKRTNNPRNLTENVSMRDNSTNIRSDEKGMWKEWKDKDLTDQ